MDSKKLRRIHNTPEEREVDVVEAREVVEIENWKRKQEAEVFFFAVDNMTAARPFWCSF